VINDDGFVVAESAAILAYLSEKHAKNAFYGNTLQQRATVNQLMHWHHSNSRQLTTLLFAPALFPGNPLPGAPAYAKRDEVLALLENRLAQHPYLCGPSASIADLLIYPDIGELQPSQCGIFDFANTPNIRAWFSRLEALPGFKESHAGAEKTFAATREGWKKLQSSSKL